MDKNIATKLVEHMYGLGWVYHRDRPGFSKWTKFDGNGDVIATDGSKEFLNDALKFRG